MYPASAFKKVEKEIVPSLLFENFDVLYTESDRKKRLQDLSYAVRLGNSMKGKVKIFFKDKEGSKCVETTIWMATDENLVLKCGTIIPLKSVYKISCY